MKALVIVYYKVYNKIFRIIILDKENKNGKKEEIKKNVLFENEFLVSTNSIRTFYTVAQPKGRTMKLNVIADSSEKCVT